MFRALAAHKKNELEEGFESSPHSRYVSEQTTKFTQQFPNMFPTGLQKNPAMALQNAKASLAVWDPNTRQPTLRDIDIATYATSVNINQELIDSHNRCKTTPIDALINTEDPRKKIRCGWIYQKGNPGDQPQISEGALGTRQGPAGFVNTPKGRWYWDLEEAKKAILGDRCGALVNCKDVSATNFSGCAYSTKRGIGVPVDTKGSLLYPKDERLSAPPNSLVMNPNACPAPPPPGSPLYEVQRSRDLCTPLENGQLSRDCMLQQITVAGCKREGALYKALTYQAMPNNYGAGLANLVSFQKYQQLASPPLLESIIREGKTTTQVALDNFKSLANASSTVENTALNFAARDLCINKGIMDQFDFCDELNSASPAPFALDCLQKAFRRAGGQPAGSEYPTESNAAKWNSLGKWSNVLNRIDALKAETMRTDEAVQRKALLEFLGIKREAYGPKQIGRMQGIETLWFNRGNNTFVGRRLVSGTSTDFPRFSTGGAVEGTGLADNVEYLSLVNLRPPSKQQIKLRLETDDGILYTKNTISNVEETRGKFIDTADAFGANWVQPPTRYDKNTCWTLQANGPNYVNGWWQEVGGYAHSQVYYAPCSGAAAWQPIPAEWMTLTQEPDAPMLSWQGTDRGFAERRMPYFFEMTLSGVSTSQQAIRDFPYSSYLNTVKNSVAITKKNIAANSWRTLTMSFIPGPNAIAAQEIPAWDNFKTYIPGDKCRIENGDVYVMIRYIGAAGYHPLRPNTQSHWTKYVDGNVLLAFGPLKILCNGSSLIFQYNSATLNATKVCANALKTSGSVSHYLYVNMRSDYDGQYPNRITFAVGDLRDWISGALTLESLGANVGTFTTSENTPLYNTSDSSQLCIGDATRVRTAEAKIGSVRLFDYELDNKDVMRDIKNEWQMAYL